MEKELELELKKRNKKKGWIFWGICISLICSLFFTATYGFFENKAKNQMENPIENENHICWLYQNSYLLYRDLYNQINRTNLNFEELYFPPVEGKEWIWDTDLKNNILYNSQELYTSDTELYNSLDYDEVSVMLDYENQINYYFLGVEENFFFLNSTYDYIIEDLETGTYLTNLPGNNLEIAEQFFYLQFLFDENGNVSIGSDVLGNNPTYIRKNANAAIRSYSLQEMFRNISVNEYGRDYFQISMPKNCVITFCISNSEWSEMQDGDIAWDTFTNSGIAEYFLLLIIFVLFAALFLPTSVMRVIDYRRISYKFPLEAIAVMVYILVSLTAPVLGLALGVTNDSIANDFILNLGNKISMQVALILVYLVNILLVGIYFFLVWFVSICVREAREIGVKEYIREKWIFYRIFPYLKKKSNELYDTVSHFDITQKANKMILKIVLVNAIIVFIISSLWVGGFVIAAVYSVILYLILRKYISDLQKKYSVLLNALNRIAEGDLNVAITEDLGVFEPFKPNVIRIQSGFRKAVDEEVKSQKMKSELITNVSHDLKTPLTAIITYINLLKEENISEEQKKEYLITLERKSLRLKVLIEDLFEVSKANSQNITLNLMDVDIINLIKQVSFEMADKMEASKLDVRMNLPEQKVILSLDSQKTYRIYENLFGNIAKYALNGTRVYVDAIVHEDIVEITLKNITAEEISVNAEDLTERFVRGDKSRNTEGSGLGLAIAKSFCELQNGSLNVRIDGDLFKVTTIWKIK